MAIQPTVVERRRAAHLGPERRRPLVLDAAMGIFLERGFEGASMEAIASAAGVSKPVVYDCFASKGELFKALFQREEARIMGEIRAALAVEPDGGDTETALADAYTAFLRAVADSPQAYRVVLLGEGGTNAAVARRIRQGRDQQVEATVAAARGWVAPARPDEDELRLFAELMIGLGEAGARALLGGSAGPPERLGPRLAAVAVTALPT